MKVLVALVVLALFATAAAIEVEVQDELTAKLFAGKGFSPMKTPTQKLPKTAADKNKKTEAKEKDGTPTPALTSKANAKAAGISKLSLHSRAMNNQVTQVTPQQFKEMKAFRVGQQVSSWINKVGGAIKSALSNFVKGIVDMLRPGGRFAAAKPPTPDKICKWVVSVDNGFQKNGWKYTSMRAKDKFGVWKPGTCTVGSSVQRLGSYNCLSSATQKSNPQTASATANANFMCLDKKGTMVSPPGKCKAKVQFYGAYKGSTYSWTDSYLVCPLGSRYIQASAAHEAQLQVGTTTLASKGAVTTTGNSITETYSFTLTAGGTAGQNKDGPSASANVGMSFGYTVTEVKDFGEKSNVVAFQHQGAFDVPFNAIMTSVAASQINGAGRVFGNAQSYTDGWLMCVVATSVDCEMQNTGISYGVGTPEQNGIYTRACEAIKRNNNVKFFL